MAKNDRFGSDPMDKFSLATGTQPTPKMLGMFLTAPVRALVEKPGRSLMVLNDLRCGSMAPNFLEAYAYVNILWQKGNEAGDHYHERKREIFTVLAGSFEVFLRSTDPGGVSEMVLLSAPEDGDQETLRLYIPAYIAHKIVARTDRSIIHVAATSPNNLADEFKFVV